MYAEVLKPHIEGLEISQIQNLVEKPKKSEMGDLAFPCFQLAKQFRKAPQQIALELSEKISHPWFAKVEAVGPYVNVFLDSVAISTPVLKEIIQQGADYGANQDGNGRNVPFDLSSPNIAKPFSMGHLRSTVIGNSVANLADKNGYQSVRINYIGDWGTQFGKLIVAYKRWGNEAAISKNPIPELLKLYVRFHEEAETDPALEEEGRKAFKSLEDGDVEAVALWTKFRAESLKEFQRIYDLMGMKFDSFNGEAFYNDKMEPVIEMLEEKGLLEESQGAQVVQLDEYQYPPALIRKSDGATLYVTRDLASAFYRKNTYDFAKSLYVVGNEQSLHFAQLKAVLKKAGHDWADDMAHISFGMMLQNGKKMSTRKGRVILLEEVLQEAIDLAERLIEEKNPALENKQEVARQVGIGAVIFQDLKNYRTNDIEFSLEAMLNFDGETGPYLQYTHARCRSLLRKAGSVDLEATEQVNDPESWPILQLLADFPQIVRLAWKEYDPSKIARFALDLARAFNQYYAHVRILSEGKEQNARLQLVYSTATVLHEALRLLGMEAPEEM
nr:arginine--tRNA ligase [Risungbinella massiliensis]